MLRTYWIKELRSLFRDRNILLYGLLLPVFLYPALLFGMSQIRLYSEGLQEQIKPSVAIVDSPRLEAWLREEAGDQFTFVRLDGDRADLVVTPLKGGTVYRIEYDSARNTSSVALKRIEPLVKAWSHEVEVRAAIDLGLGAEPFTGDPVRLVNVADPERSTRYLISMILPLVLVVMCTFGATYPAVELTAGERERTTAETTILLPLSRQTIALGKSLAVTSAAFIALIVNLFAMLFSAGPMLVSIQGGVAALPALAWSSLPLIFCFGILLSLVFANLFLLVGSYARNYREAQAYVTPLQVVVMLPALLTLLPGTELNPVTALIPVYNAGLAFRASLLGDPPFVPILLSLASLGLFSLVCFRATVRRLSDTVFVLGFKDPDQLLEAEA